MKTRYILLTLLAIALLSGSCIPTKTISFESLQPAGFSFPDSGDSISILNLSYYPWVDTSAFSILKNLNPSEAYIIDTMIMKSLFDGFFTVLDFSEINYLQNTGYQEIRGENTEGFLNPLDSESVNLLCNDFKSDILICLEYYGMDYKFQYLSQDMNWIPLVTINTKLIWRIYHQDSGMIDEKVSVDNYYWEGIPGNTRGKSLSDLPDLVNIIRDAFWYAGESYGNYISPNWKAQERVYFPVYYESEDISMDDEGLTRLISETANNVKKYKALYNYAVFLEKEGKTQEAIEAIDKALIIRPESYFAQEYKNLLKEKLILQKKLKEQLIPAK